jgi:hypothetical protein
MRHDLSPRSVLSLLLMCVGVVSVADIPGTPTPSPSPPIGAGAAQVEMAPKFKPLRLDPSGDEDPLVVFQRWRIESRVDIVVLPAVVEAHKAWRKLHGLPEEDLLNGDGESQARVPESSQATPNVCPASGVSGYQGEISIVVNPYNPNQAVAGANTFYRDPTSACQSPTGGSGNTYGTQALYGSTDGGATWTYNCAPWPAADTGGCAAGLFGSKYFFGSDPTVAWDANGNAYAVYMLISQGTNFLGQLTCLAGSLVIAKSTNAGGTWSALGVIVNNLGNTSVFDDKELMAIDTTVGKTHSHTNRIYVIWDQNNNERIAYSDNGTTWTTVVLETTGSDIGGEVAIGPDGTVYAVWNRTATSGDSLVFAKSVDGGATWTTPTVISTHRLSSFPGTGSTQNKPPAQDQRGVNVFAALAVDTVPTSPYFGYLYAVYNDFPVGTTSGTNLNIYLMRSTDGGATWGTPVKVNDDGGTATQFFPWVAVDPTDGTISLSWYDTRNDANNKKTQIYFARSSNGGVSFTTNLKVSQTSSAFANSGVDYCDENSTDNTNYNGNQYGDYAQLSSLSGVSLLGWTDSRQFYPTSGDARIEDLATASVCTVPGLPTGLSASAPSSSQVVLSWSPGSPAGATYTVYRATGTCASGPSFIPIASGVTGGTYSDTSATPASTTYSYKVSAVDRTGRCASDQTACVQVSPVKPVPSASGATGNPVRVSKVTADGGQLTVTYDTTSCTDTNYAILYGNGNAIATYALSGSQCAMGTTGSYAWNPAPSVPGGQTFIWFVVVGTDGVDTESSWGKDSSGNERHPAPSGFCGSIVKNIATSCP